MVFPVIKIVMVAFRYACKPLNGVLIRTIKQRGNHSKIKLFFANIGQKAHRFEVRINRYIVNDASSFPNQKPGDMKD